MLLAVPPAGFLAAGLVDPVVGFFTAGFRVDSAGLLTEVFATGFFTVLVAGEVAALAVVLLFEGGFPTAAVFFTAADGLAAGFTGVFTGLPTALEVLTAGVAVFAVGLAFDFVGATVLVFPAGSLVAIFFITGELAERVVLVLTAVFAAVAFVRGVPDFFVFAAGAAFAAAGLSAERVRFGCPSNGKAN